MSSNNIKVERDDAEKNEVERGEVERHRGQQEIRVSHRKIV